MPESSITGHVWPEDTQTGTDTDREDWSSAGYIGGTLARDNASDYVERGLGLTPDYVNNTLTVEAGLAFIKHTASIGVQEPSDDETTFSGTWDQHVTFAVETKQASGIGISDGAINRVWLATDLSTNDGTYIRTDTEANPNVPPQPRLKLGEVDTNSDVATEENREPDLLVGDIDVEGHAGLDLADAESGGAASGQVPTADGSGGVVWDDAGGGSETAEVVSNLSVQNWNVIDVGNEGFPGDGTGGDLAQFIRDNTTAGSHNLYYLPEGTYEWQQTLKFNEVDLPIPEGLAIVGKPEATIHVTSGVQADAGYCFALGEVYGDHNNQMENCYIANLHFDVGAANDNRDAGIGRHQTGKNCLFENLSITRRYRRNDDGSTNGDRFTWRMDVGDKTATTYCRNFDFTAGERYNENNDETVGHAIPISGENDHVGTAVWENCQVAEYVDNGFYLRDGYGTHKVVDCYARDVGGGGYRLGENDVLEDSYIEYTTAADYYGAGLWVQDGNNTHVDGLEIDVQVAINDCIRLTDQIGGIHLENLQVFLANNSDGDYIMRGSNSSNDDAMVVVRDMTVDDRADGSTREGSIELRSPHYVFEGLTWYDTNGRVPFSQRFTGTGHTIIRDSYFELDGVGVARAGSNLDAPDVDYVFEGCEFVNVGAGTGLIWDSRPHNSLERLVLRDCDCSDYPDLFYEDTRSLSEFTIGELRSCIGYANQAHNDYTGP